MKVLYSIFACCALSIICPVLISAQGFSADFSLSSKLLWRGMEMTASPTIYPTIGYEAGGFNIYSTAAYAVDDSYQEWDFGISYTAGNFTVEVIDYYYPALSSEKFPDTPRYDFYNWKNSTTGHQLDCMLYYTPESVPVKAMLAVITFGDDKLADGSNAFSSYVEIGWYHDFKDESRLEVNLGASLRESPVYGTEGFAFINTELKYSRSLEFKSVQIPLGMSLMYNPYIRQPFLGAVAGIAF